MLLSSLHPLCGVSAPFSPMYAFLRIHSGGAGSGGVTFRGFAMRVVRKAPEVVAVGRRSYEGKVCCEGHGIGRMYAYVRSAERKEMIFL